MSVCRIHRSTILLSALAALLVTVTAPAAAHEEHRRQREAALKAEQLRQAQTVARPTAVAPSTPGPATMHAEMGAMMDMPKVDRSKMSYSARLLDWLGRLHPIIVHFPIAFFPAAFFTAIVGRRRPAFATPVQFLVVAGGVLAPIAAILGWFDGGFTLATDDWTLSYHRWLGTGIGVGALALAIWAVRKPEDDRGPGMIAALGLMTFVIIIQGWLGGALVHGVGHMNW